LGILKFSKKLESLSKPVSRLAPTPSGYLHLGNAFSFILTWLLVRRLEGKLHLRIDDLDSARLKRDCLEDIFIQLDWLGLDYDSGPQSPDEHLKYYSQKFRIGNYREALSSLREKGSVYACRCSRKQYLAISKDGLYPKTCLNKNLDLDQPNMIWRFKSDSTNKSNIDFFESFTEDQSLAMHLGDTILLRRNRTPSYQIGSLVDDMIDKSTLIVRGVDLYPSSMFQISMAEKLRWTLFSEICFVHHSLLKDSTGKKYAKSEGGYSLKDLKQKHSNSSFIYRGFASWLGLPNSNIHDLKSLQEIFSTIPLDQFWEMNLVDFPNK
jgi:glutamyl/glutaminyl-tRNA synthetase